jgi:hypothetical protein
VTLGSVGPGPEHGVGLPLSRGDCRRFRQPTPQAAKTGVNGAADMAKDTIGPAMASSGDSRGSQW